MTEREPFIERRIAIITGASSGLGWEFARQLVRHHIGLKKIRGLPFFNEIWLIARRKERLLELEKTLSAISGKIPLSILSLPLDLSAKESVSKIEIKLREAGSQSLALLINNAGYGTYGPLLDVDIEAQLGQIDLNCRSLSEACARLGPFLSQKSLVLNVASLAAFAPLAGFAIYAATKAYVLSLSQALAAEWEGRGIRVHALCPGSVESEFALVASGGVRKEVLHGYSCEKTVARALRAAARGAWFSIPRFLWRLNYLATRLFSARLIARFSRRFLQRPYKPAS